MHAWRDARIVGPVSLLALAAAGLGALMLMVFEGPYPLAMAGSPGEDVSNSAPPKATLLALGALQFGLLLSIQGPMRRLLGSLRLWTATVLINSMIMTIYLWHITVMIVVIGLAYLAGGIGLGAEPGSGEWWSLRPVWLLVMYAVLLPVALLISPLERRALPKDAAPPGAARQIGGAAMICLGIALLARFGYGGQPVEGFGVVSFSLVVVGSVVSGLLPTPWRKR